MSLVVKDFVGKRGKKGNIGIEIEVEGEEDLSKCTPGDSWVVHQEGSLRKYGIEYVTDGPLVISEVPKALKTLKDSLSKYKIDYKSPRASVHMHSNVLYHTPIQYWNMVTTYWLTENLLFDFCGDHRKGNCFCLRLSDAEGVLRHCLEDLRNDMPFMKFGRDQIRYAGQNLEATRKFGSIEYRGMAFTLDTSKLTNWANAIHNLNLNSKSFESPDKLMDTYFSKQPLEFLVGIFGQEFAERLTCSSDWVAKLEQNEGILCELAYFHDWDKWASRIEKNHKEYKPSAQMDEIFDRIAEERDAIDDVPVQNDLGRGAIAEAQLRGAANPAPRQPVPR